MSRGFKTPLIVLGFILTLVILTVHSIQNNHHKIALDYLEKALRLKVLQVLYPEKKYTKANYTTFSLIDPLVTADESNFRKYKEIELSSEPYERENATFFSLVRNEELYLMLESIKYVEERFNKRYNYDWIFANDNEFTEEFKAEVSNLVSGNSTFVLIPKEYWSYPDFIDEDKAAATRSRMKKANIKYGGSASYRHMCRFNSGFFYKLKAFEGIKYYWRVEPEIKYTCDLEMDFFKYMRENNLKYGWTMALHEISSTVNGLWESTIEFFRELHPEYVSPDNQIEFVTQDNEKTFNMCHYWSNFEVGDLDFLRSTEYEEYFQFLDHKGGFFYERWGDAPVHTLAASFMLNKSEVHYFDNTGYYHVPHTQCPRLPEKRYELHCTCQVSGEFNWGSRDSCLPYWIETRNEEKPSYAPRITYATRKVKPPTREEQTGKAPARNQLLKRDDVSYIDEEEIIEDIDDLYTINKVPEREAFMI